MQSGLQIRGRATAACSHSLDGTPCGELLRRLRLKGLIERVPGTHTYLITAYGRRIATFFTRLAARVVVPGLTAPPSLLAAWRTHDAEIRRLILRAGLAA